MQGLPAAAQHAHKFINCIAVTSYMISTPMKMVLINLVLYLYCKYVLVIFQHFTTKVCSKNVVGPRTLD